MSSRGNYATIAGTVRINNYLFGKKSVEMKNTFKLSIFFFIRYIKQILTAFYSEYSLKL